jgi:hypothetical protein
MIASKIGETPGNYKKYPA